VDAAIYAQTKFTAAVFARAAIVAAFSARTILAAAIHAAMSAALFRSHFRSSVWCSRFKVLLTQYLFK
jgi:hypothetical protein